MFATSSGVEDFATVVERQFIMKLLLEMEIDIDNYSNDEFEQLKDDIADNNFRGVKYIDTWDYEDYWSHNDIENAIAHIK